MKRDELRERLEKIGTVLLNVQGALDELLEEVRASDVKGTNAPCHVSDAVTSKTGVPVVKAAGQPITMAEIARSMGVEPDSAPAPVGAYVPLPRDLMVLVTLEDGRQLHAIADGQGGCWCNGRLFMEPGAPEPNVGQLNHCAGWVRAKRVETQGREAKGVL